MIYIISNLEILYLKNKIGLKISFQSRKKSILRLAKFFIKFIVIIVNGYFKYIFVSPEYSYYEHSQKFVCE